MTDSPRVSPNAAAGLETPRSPLEGGQSGRATEHFSTNHGPVDKTRFWPRKIGAEMARNDEIQRYFKVSSGRVESTKQSG